MIRPQINQALVPAPSRIALPWLKRLLRAIEKRLRLRGIWTLSIAFVDHRTMRRLNLTYRDRGRVTDILSFAGVGDGQSLGELVLAWPYVRDEAKRNKKSLKEELALLLIHGVLHLVGYDHETARDASKMLPLQEKILQDFLKR
ncbi:rRNA maturation RNase YbeY [Candidatus Uhrbacteria bacterium]|nr:rRNA maturation RNase YbeY [Candidatus Uhrbacteria bacterium]